MPTPVSSARQCLTEEAARALDDAVAVAKRRSHAQTTSLHAVSALLALPSSALREACARARSSAYSPRLQFKALELCVGVSLDRLPTTKTTEEPPISNSLMAAIKRSQANQRRHPETFHLYQQLQHQAGAGNSSSPPPSISTVKVELKHFILSILDDPIVSRVFGEAGFRSYELKMAILNPPTISSFSKPRCPPLFLCNLSDLELNKRGFSFPFPGVLGSSSSSSGSEDLDENSRRIGEVFIKKTARNPLLVGNSVSDALNEFTDVVRKCKAGVLPREIEGLCVVSLDQDLSDLEKLRLKFVDVEDVVKGCQGGAGAVISYGDLKVFLDPGEGVKYAVSQLSRLVELYDKKLWLIGYAANFDVYMKFLVQFPCAEKDWDLHFMPITSSKPTSVGGAGLPSRSSLMGSFVPFGGFFSAPSDFEPPRRITNQSAARCTTCNEKYEQEASAVLKEGSTVSASEQYSANLSPWMQITEADKIKSFGIHEAKDDRSLGNARLMALDVKWNDICRRIHHQASPSKVQYQNTDEFQLSSARSGSSISDERRLPDQSPRILSDSQNATSLLGTPVQRPILGNLRSPPFAFEYMKDTDPHHRKPSVTTDLVLGTLYTAPMKEPRNPQPQECNDSLQHSGSVSADASSENASNRVTHSFYSSREHPNEKDFKHIWRLLSEKVSWQDEAVSTLSRVVASCRNGHGQNSGPDRGNIWLSLLGPDKVGKRKIASALAEALFGSTKSLLRFDLGSLSRNRSSNTIFDREDSKSYERNLRGKTMVDHIAEELGKKSESVVLLENVDEADILVQNSLSQALKTGKFPNSHMREVNVNNRVFVITSSVSKGAKDFLSGNDQSSEYSEERVLAAADSPMQIRVGCASRDTVRIRNTNLLVSPRKGGSLPSTPCKRKFAETTRSCFDLNLPVEETEDEEEEGGYNSSDSDSASESSKAWLEDFLEQVNGNVELKPYDFGILAQKILTQIDFCFKKAVGSSHFLEIESETVLQMLAATWLAEKENGMEDWIREVLYRAFEEASDRCSLGPNMVLKLAVLGRGNSVEEEEEEEGRSPGICLPVKVSVV